MLFLPPILAADVPHLEQLITSLEQGIAPTHVLDAGVEHLGRHDPAGLGVEPTQRPARLAAHGTEALEERRGLAVGIAKGLEGLVLRQLQPRQFLHPRRDLFRLPAPHVSPHPYAGFLGRSLIELALFDGVAEVIDGVVDGLLLAVQDRHHPVGLGAQGGRVDHPADLLEVVLAVLSSLVQQLDHSDRLFPRQAPVLHGLRS
jgi:hypothetical protein